MERKTHNSLNEAALEVQLGDTTQEPETNEVEMPDMVFEYFNNYFGDNLNEDTDDEDIIKAVEDLVDLCEAVCDAVGIDEAFDRANTTSKLGGPYNFAPANKKDYLKPSPEQLKTALAKQADNSPILQTGQGTNTKTVRPSDVQAKKRAKRIKRMKKFKM